MEAPVQTLIPEDVLALLEGMMGRSTHNRPEFREILARATEHAQHIVQNTFYGEPLIARLSSPAARRLEHAITARVAARNLSSQLGTTSDSSLAVTPIGMSELDREIIAMREQLTQELATTFGIPADQLEQSGNGREWIRQEYLGDFPADGDVAKEEPIRESSPMEALHEHAVQEIQRREDEFAMYQLYDAATRREVAPRDPLDTRFMRDGHGSVGYYSEMDELPAPAPEPRRAASPKPREEARVVSFEPGQRIIDIEG